ncbi:phospholipase C/P1 nuclease domain-containing protein [Dichomitus squalens]|uniref:Phospholipase C/P1 nuclease domain-containing protein n=2 Tax=Dichomitus squalens TaxID=114155 RepID=A0A4Q9Q1M5_9APHY|nr:phospholipase C/P1 nuclease domain-containing protein [Dichomitus squalens]TBU61103.1 phospholipase C/P1 nuclease domain-containing protein [Dichomitus squalens]
MRISSLHALVLTAVLAGAPSAYAWGAAGHEIVATIAQIHLPKPVLQTVCDILNPFLDDDTTASPFQPPTSSCPNPRSASADADADASYPPCHLASIAAWADQVRSKPQYRYTAPLHYVNAVDDAPADACAFPGPHGWQGRPTGNVLAALGNVTRVLRGFAAGEQGAGAADEALRFLVHWVGDMHQPLHMSGREKGGNGARVQWNGRVTNLHSVWDGLLIAQSIRQTPRNYSRPLAGPAGALVEAHLRGAIYDPFVRRIMHEGLAVGGRFDGESDGWLDCPEPSAGVQPLEQGYGWQARLQALRALDYRAALGLTTPAGAEARWDDGTLCPYAWARPIHALNCELPVWPHELDEGGHREASGAERGEEPRRHPELVELDTAGYAGKIAEGWVVERLLAMAGVRLAGVLTDVFQEVSGEAVIGAGV